MRGQEELELRLLEEKHLANLLQLEKERALLNRDNPFRTAAEPPPPATPHPRAPVLPPDQATERHLYHPHSQWPKHSPHIEQRLYYPPSRTESYVAGREIDMILRQWESQARPVPHDLHLRELTRRQPPINFDKELTDRGKQETLDLIYMERKAGLMGPPSTIKQKYLNLTPSKTTPDSNRKDTTSDRK